MLHGRKKIVREQNAPSYKYAPTPLALRGSNRRGPIAKCKRELGASIESDAQQKREFSTLARNLT